QAVWINVTPHPTADWIARQIAVRLGRTASPKDRLIDPTRVPRPCDRLGRGAPTRDSASLCPLLQRFENAPIVGQRRAILAPGSADRSRQVACCSRWTASPVHASLSFRYTQVGGAPTFWAPLRGRYIRCGALPRPAQRDMPALDQKDVVRLLRSEVTQEGSQKAWAKKYGVAPSAISMVLSGDRPPNDKIISALKLHRVVVFERVDE